MKKASMDRILRGAEDGLPIIAGILVVIIFLINPVSIIDEMSDVLNAIISLTSILLGFIGVVVTLLFGLTHTKIVNTVFDERYSYKNRLKRFFVENCCSGFILIVLSVLMFFKNTIQSLPTIRIWYVLKYSFAFFLVYFLGTAFRLIYITIELVFLAAGEEQDEVCLKDEKSDYTELRKKYERL